ncbi:MAG: alcohol dehydrogenase catalytic domain-containing protein [Anaerolineae bacterium]|nr:alcohol dehydrogenase catalytic domain-containing protein [Anaerolineae bacterium]
MHALVLDRSLRYTANYPMPDIVPGEALIRVRLAGICNTDQELRTGYLDFKGILGHEFVGIVERSPGFEHWEGQRVVGDINVACQRCPTCLRGMPSHCPNRTTLGIQGRDGAFASYLTLPVANLYTVPDAIPDDAAVFTEPLAAACEILEQIPIRPTHRVIVIGDGKLGLLCAQVLAATGCHLVALGHHEEKLAHLVNMGIQVALDPGEIPPGADVVVEATGHPGGYLLASELVRPRGTVVLKSTYHGEITVNLSRQVVNEITLVGSRCGPFAPALRMLEQGRVNVTPLISARYPLEQGVVAFDRAAQRGMLKILLDIA